MQKSPKNSGPFHFIWNITNKLRMVKYPVPQCGIVNNIADCVLFILFIWPNPNKYYSKKIYVVQ